MSFSLSVEQKATNGLFATLSSLMFEVATSNYKLQIFGLNNKAPRFQATGMPQFGKSMVGTGGIEPPTPAASRQCSPTELRAYRTKILLATAGIFVKKTVS